MSEVVFFLEEASAAAMLQGVLPRLLPAGAVPRFISFSGKSDLERQLVGKLRGWQTPDTRFVVLRDKDAGDCVATKVRLGALCAAARVEELGREQSIWVPQHVLAQRRPVR